MAPSARSRIFKDSSLIVVAFLGTECPLAKLYGPRLAELAAKYKDRGVTFLGVDANRQDSLAEIAAYARDSGIEFPVLKDAGNVVADAIDAQRTPEVFLLDKDRVIRYRGRIDDRCGVGYVRDKGTHDYLIDAIDQLLAGQEVKTPFVEPVGCFIGRTHKANEKSDVYLLQANRADFAGSLRELSSPWRDRSVRHDRLQRSLGLGRRNCRSRS